MRVSTVAREEFVAAFESAKQMKSGNGTAGAVGLAIVTADDQRRTIGAFDHSGCRDTNHAAMPSVAVKYDAAGIGKLRFAEPCFESLHNLLLACLAIRIKLIQSRRQLARFIFFSRFEQLDDSLGNIHAAGGVHSWC